VGIPADSGTGTSAEYDPRILTASPTGAKSIGHTSVVFKVRLEGDLLVVFKPRSQRGHRRYRGELGAYRLATALGLDCVPPALFRTFEAAKLRTLLGGPRTPAGELFDKEAVIDADGTVPGSIVPWIDRLEFLPLENEPWSSRWKGWLKKGAAIPDDQRALAGQVSTMVVFDYLTGNWDRWSGANVGWLREKNFLLYMDNDGAFFDPPPKGPMDVQLGLIRGIDRFSKRFVKSVRDLEPGKLAAALGEESPGTPLFSASVLAQVEERRKQALAIVDAKLKANGESETYFFE
jgi:hypothetical protein